jgi:putative transposase
MTILKRAEAGMPTPELCREHGIIIASLHKWLAKYGGMDAPVMSRVKYLEAESAYSMKMYAEV